MRPSCILFRAGCGLRYLWGRKRRNRTGSGLCMYSCVVCHECEPDDRPVLSRRCSVCWRHLRRNGRHHQREHESHVDRDSSMPCRFILRCCSNNREPYRNSPRHGIDRSSNAQRHRLGRYPRLNRQADSYSRRDERRDEQSVRHSRGHHRHPDRRRSRRNYKLRVVQSRQCHYTGRNSTSWNHRYRNSSTSTCSFRKCHGHEPPGNLVRLDSDCTESFRLGEAAAHKYRIEQGRTHALRNSFTSVQRCRKRSGNPKTLR